jgi:peptidoglycan/LPS O-acetylase OafA/YrhL
LLLVGIYPTYSFIAYGFAVNITHQWAFALIVPGAVALALIPVLVGCELWNRKARLRRAPQRRTAFVLFWVGELTYPIYLVHGSILASVQRGLPHATFAVRWAIATVLVILIAWVFHITVEEAVLKWRRGRATKTENRVVPETLQELTPSPVFRRYVFAQEPLAVGIGERGVRRPAIRLGPQRDWTGECECTCTCGTGAQRRPGPHH